MISQILSAESSLAHTLKATADQLDAVGRGDLTAALADLERAAGEAKQRLAATADRVRAVVAGLLADVNAIAGKLAEDLAGRGACPPAPDQQQQQPQQPVAPAIAAAPAAPQPVESNGNGNATPAEQLAEEIRVMRDNLDAIKGIDAPEEVGTSPLPSNVLAVAVRYGAGPPQAAQDDAGGHLDRHPLATPPRPAGSATNGRKGGGGKRR